RSAPRPVAGRRAFGGVRFATEALDLDALAFGDLLQGDHVRRGLVDRARERDRTFQHGRELLRVLDARVWILVFDDQVDVRHALLELEALAGRQLVIQPVDRAV